VNCKEVIQQLSDFLDGDLEPGLAEELRSHLTECRDCHIIVDTTRKTIEIFCNSEPLPLPQPVRERLMRALAARFGGPKSS
jgi:anti-sigma factor (TIGR02949 family)